MARKHNPPNSKPPYPNDRYPLVGTRELLRDAPTETGWPQSKLARFTLGFEADWFLPTKLARRWRTILYPLHATDESIQQWELAVEEQADACQGAFAIPSRSAETLADFEADLELIRESKLIPESEAYRAEAAALELWKSRERANMNGTLLPIVSLGDRNYQAGDQPIVVVDPAEDEVLQVFFRTVTKTPKWIALEKPKLEELSGYGNAARILKRIATKHPALAQAIDCPGKRGQGGLKIFAMKATKPK